MLKKQTLSKFNRVCKTNSTKQISPKLVCVLSVLGSGAGAWFGRSANLFSHLLGEHEIGRVWELRTERSASIPSTCARPLTKLAAKSPSAGAENKKWCAKSPPVCDYIARAEQQRRTPSCVVCRGRAAPPGPQQSASRRSFAYAIIISRLTSVLHRPFISSLLWRLGKNSFLSQGCSMSEWFNCERRPRKCLCERTTPEICVSFDDTLTQRRSTN